MSQFSLMPDDSKPKTLFSRWHLALWLIALLCLAIDMRLALNERKVVQAVTEISMDDVQTPTPTLAELAEHDQRVLADFSGTQGRPKLELHESHPTHPGYFSQYLAEYKRVNGSLPDDLLEEAKQIDPGNALYPLLEAHEVLGDHLENEDLLPRKPTDWESEERIRHRHPPQRYEILDQAAFDEALALVKQACELPRIQTYNLERQHEVGEILERVGRTETLPGLIGSMLLWLDGPLPSLSFMKANRVIAAAAYQAMQDEDRDKLLELVAMREQLVRQLSECEDRLLIDALVYQAVAMVSANDFEHYCRELGLDELAAKYQKQGQALHDRKERCRKDPYRADLLELFEMKKTSTLHGLMMPVIFSHVEEAPEFTETQLRPLREAEHDFATRMGLRSLAVVLLLFAGAAHLVGRHRSKKTGGAGKELLSALKPVDWALVCLVGGVLPLIVFWLIMQHTPLGGRQVGVFHLLLLQPGLALGVLLALVPLTMAHCMRWRIGVRCTWTQTKPVRKWLFVLVLGVNLLALVMAYLVLLGLHPDRSSRTHFVYLALMFTPPISLLVVMVLSFVRAYRGGHEERTILSATCLGIARCMPAAMIACLLTASAFRMSESHWVAQDRTLRLNVDEEHLGIYEIKVANQLYREVDAIVLPEEQ